jgi:hypothetical protein
MFVERNDKEALLHSVLEGPHVARALVFTHAGHDHQYGKAESERREFAITDPADKQRINEPLHHHQEDAVEHGHGHVDQMSAN